MTSDATNNILALALESARLDLERARMRGEDARARLWNMAEASSEMRDEFISDMSFTQSVSSEGCEICQMVHRNACEALETLDPGNPLNR